MRVSNYIGCTDFPCMDVRHECYLLPDIHIVPDRMSIILISESAPTDPKDYYYADGDPHFKVTTLQAFNQAGIEATSITDLLDMGIYLTTAIKCGKTEYNIKPATIKSCSQILEQEISLFANVKAFLLMGDVAIKAINYIAKRCGEQRVIPAGSTYKIRGEAYYFRNARAFPSYLQAGPSFGIEKSKQKMIAEDIAAAFSV